MKPQLIQNRQKGYSLFEVLIAFFIMSSVLAALLPTNVSLFSSMNRTQERLLAQDYAQSRLATLGISRPLRSGSEQGSYSEIWIWRESIELVPHGSADQDIFEAEVTIVSKKSGLEIVRYTVLKASPL